MCVLGWRSGSDRNRRSNIVYDSLPRRFILGKLKLCCGLAFDLDSLKARAWAPACVFDREGERERQTWEPERERDRERWRRERKRESKGGRETGGLVCKKKVDD